MLGNCAAARNIADLVVGSCRAKRGEKNVMYDVCTDGHCLLRSAKNTSSGYCLHLCVHPERVGRGARERERDYWRLRGGDTEFSRALVAGELLEALAQVFKCLSANQNPVWRELLILSRGGVLYRVSERW